LAKGPGGEKHVTSFVGSLADAGFVELPALAVSGGDCILCELPLSNAEVFVLTMFVDRGGSGDGDE
jgi:hypothetical protein